MTEQTITQLEDRFMSKVTVEPENDCWTWQAGMTQDGYGVYSIRHVSYRAHRVSYEAVKGPIPAGMMVDHICRRKSCVNPDHLRLVTNKQNQEHRPATTASGYRGVARKRQKYSARVFHNGKNIWVGVYDTAEEAAEAARAKRQELFTHDDEGAR